LRFRKADQRQHKDASAVASHARACDIRQKAAHVFVAGQAFIPGCQTGRDCKKGIDEVNSNSILRVVAHGESPHQLNPGNPLGKFIT